MIFSESWLREFVDPGMDTSTLVETLTMAGLEVDGVEAAAADFSGVVVGLVEEAQQHPDADKLSLCTVSDGSERFQVVCGAPNVRAGLRVPFAKVGAVLNSGDKPFKIKAAKLRGVESHGMLCSAEELGLAEASVGILELPESLTIGQDVREAMALDDTLIELDLTPNRGDCLGMIGLAREVGVLARADVKQLEIPAVESSSERSLSVATEAPEACPRYLGRVIEGISLDQPSPLWLQERLRRSGVRSIDPVVDVTNLMLLELGQPMHAFDADKLTGTVRARMARAGEKLTLLDEREVTLDESTLVIADDAQALAMAGVMGGLSSSVTPATSSIFLECAYFSPLAIAGKARSYGLHTDASHRYERGVDWALQERAIERATEILVSLVGGKVGPVVSATGALPEPRHISLALANVKRLLGVEVPRDECRDILHRLGFDVVEDRGDTLVYSVPSYRFDCQLEADLIEEIARVFGYNNLPKTPTLGRLALAKNSEKQLPLSTLKQRLVAAGFQEVINYSFIDPALAENLCPEQEPVRLQNPLSTEMSVMRPSILPGLLTTLEYNVNRQRDRVRLFETGLVFESCGGEIQQARKIGGLIYGSSHPVSWAQAKKGVDFFDLKGVVESLLDLGLGLSAVEFRPASHPSLHPGQCAELVLDTQTIGLLGALHPRVQRHFGFAQAPYLFELDAEPLLAKTLAKAQALSKFPAVARDLAVVVGSEVLAGDVERCVRSEAADELVDFALFDVYEGENLGEGKKSIALSLTLQHPSRTLSDEETSAIIAKCIKALAAKFDAELRD